MNTTLAHSLHTLDEWPELVDAGIGNGADGQSILVHGVRDDELVGNVSILLPLPADDVEDIVSGDGPELVGVERGPGGNVVMRRQGGQVSRCEGRDDGGFGRLHRRRPCGRTDGTWRQTLGEHVKISKDLIASAGFRRVYLKQKALAISRRRGYQYRSNEVSITL